MIRIRFEPSGRTVAVLPRVCLLEAAAQAGFTIDTPCGGAGTCGKCRVRFVAAAPPPTTADEQHLEPRELDAGWRLACGCHVESPAQIEIPADSLFAGEHQIVQTAAAGEAPAVESGVSKQFAAVPRPSLGDTAALSERLIRSIGPCEIPAELVRQLHRLLRDQDYGGTAVIADGQLIDFESGDTTAACYGVAIDVGTTTVVASVHDLHTGHELAVAATLNSQVRVGDDVLSRIRHASESADGLAELHRAVWTDCAGLIDGICRSAEVSPRHVYRVVVAGNTTMQHLAADIDPTPLGEVPFVPVHAHGLTLTAEGLGLPIHPRARIHVLPVIGGFVGGDTVAGLVATRLNERADRTLLIDIGTNGEIVLLSDGRLWATSAAAGPAFEGARISCGMRAAPGAIEKVSLVDGELVCGTVGGAAAGGICGSGLIDAAAEMLRCGAVRPEGRLVGPAEIPEGAPPDLVRRIETDSQGKYQFRLTDKPATGGRGVVVTQRDVRELQLATGAIRAATRMLLKRAGLTAGDLDTVFVAGGFGSFIRRNNAQRIGLLPAGVAHDRIRFVGNVSLRGAQWSLLSGKIRSMAEDLARRVELVELSTDPDFHNEFAEAMIFPDSQAAD